ncbi:hypothetical protein BD779DRAFT_1472416 [Infundibulicybe gibba]|nr:hypothetical protein BD779DRAFT_1472416 [Infundibulicybe gibba]
MFELVCEDRDFLLKVEPGGAAIYISTWVIQLSLLKCQRLLRKKNTIVPMKSIMTMTTQNLEEDEDVRSDDGNPHLDDEERMDKDEYGMDHDDVDDEPYLDDDGVATVTGSAHRIGRAIALRVRLADKGLDFALESLAREILQERWRSMIIMGNVSVEEGVKSVMSHVGASLGEFDVIRAESVDGDECWGMRNKTNRSDHPRCMGTGMIYQGRRGHLIAASSLTGKRGFYFTALVAGLRVILQHVASIVLYLASKESRGYRPNSGPSFSRLKQIKNKMTPMLCALRGKFRMSDDDYPLVKLGTKESDRWFYEVDLSLRAAALHGIPESIIIIRAKYCREL